jgi:hypothetical protein
LIELLDRTRIVEEVRAGGEDAVWQSDLYPELRAYYEARQPDSADEEDDGEDWDDEDGDDEDWDDEDEDDTTVEPFEHGGTTVLRHETDEGRPGGAWADYIYELDGEYWTYLSSEDQVDGPYASLEDAMSEAFELSSVSVSYSAPGMTAAEIAALFSLEYAEEGDSVWLNGENWEVVLEASAAPVSQDAVCSVLATIAAEERSRTGPDAYSDLRKSRPDLAAMGVAFARAQSERMVALRREIEEGEDIDVKARLSDWAEKYPEIAELVAAIESNGYTTEPASEPISWLRLVPAP